MQRVSLEKLIKRNCEGRIFHHDNSLIWTNKEIAVRDDPNITHYFGGFILKRVIQDETLYYLYMSRGRVIIEESTSESLSSYLNPIDQFFNFDPNSLLRLLHTQMKVEEIGKPKSQILLTEDKELVFVDSDYFEYLYNFRGTNHEFYLNPRNQPAILFAVNGKYTGVVAPVKPFPIRWNG